MGRDVILSGLETVGEEAPTALKLGGIMLKKSIILMSVAACSLVITGLGSPSLAQTTEQISLGNAKACAERCEATLKYCTDKKGKYGEAHMTNIIKDCITACKTASEFSGRSSQYARDAFATAAKACLECAKACEAFKDDDKMLATANECRKTASNMQKVASAGVTK
jgi:hypothetical protein